VRLQIGRVDHDGLVLDALGGEPLHQPGKDTHVLSPLPLVVERRRCTLLNRRITPPQTIAIEEDYAVENPPIIDTLLAMALWKERSQPLDLLVCQPD
jgi:hypothetical protein